MKRLSLRYSIQQILYWAANCSVFSFAAAFLLGKGFSAANVGVILFSGDLLSCFLQPFAAGIADRAKRNILPLLIGILASLCILCYLILFIFEPPFLLYGILYLVGVLTFDMMFPLLNATSVYYNARGGYINYGLGRGLGALSFSFASLGIGYFLRYADNRFLLLINIGLLLAFLLLSVTYPRAEGSPDAVNETSVRKENTSSLPVFFKTYRLYSISLAGVFFLATFHIMVENYMIEIIGRLGGDSSNLGTALFIACITACPVMIFFDRIHDRLGTRRIFLIAGLAYVLKGLLFILAKSVTAIYLIELLQCVTYNFLSPVQMYYARDQVPDKDMVKGQSMITAAYTLGCAAGNLAGGQIITRAGVPVMLRIALGCAVTGAVILFVTVKGKRKE